MMNNLFQMFDPSSIMNPSHLTMALVMMIVLYSMKNSKKTSMKIQVEKMLSKEIYPSMNKNQSGKKFMIMFMMISSINIISLVPSSFSLTAQVSVNFPIAMMMWLSANMFTTVKKTKKTLSHLVPTGSPKMLAPLMVMIELTSNMIRPITLSVRLTANMVAGHIMILLMENMSTQPNTPVMMSMIMSTMLMILETGVAVIQGYVFTILVTLYAAENH